MDRKQRIAMQRALAQEALGKLRAAAELFGAENDAIARDRCEEFSAWNSKVAEIEDWIYGESPVA